MSEDDNSHRSVCFIKACASLHELQQQTKPTFLTSYCFGVLEEVIIKAVLYDLSESLRDLCRKMTIVTRVPAVVKFKR